MRDYCEDNLNALNCPINPTTVTTVMGSRRTGSSTNCINVSLIPKWTLAGSQVFQVSSDPSFLHEIKHLINTKCTTWRRVIKAWKNSKVEIDFCSSAWHVQSPSQPNIWSKWRRWYRSQCWRSSWHEMSCLSLKKQLIFYAHESGFTPDIKILLTIQYAGADSSKRRCYLFNYICTLGSHYTSSAEHNEPTS